MNRQIIAIFACCSIFFGCGAQITFVPQNILVIHVDDPLESIIKVDTEPCYETGLMSLCYPYNFFIAQIDKQTRTVSYGLVFTVSVRGIQYVAYANYLMQDGTLVKRDTKPLGVKPIYTAFGDYACTRSYFAIELDRPIIDFWAKQGAKIRFNGVDQIVTHEELWSFLKKVDEILAIPVYNKTHKGGQP